MATESYDDINETPSFAAEPFERLAEGDDALGGETNLSEEPDSDLEPLQFTESSDEVLSQESEGELNPDVEVAAGDLEEDDLETAEELETAEDVEDSGAFEGEEFSPYENTTHEITSPKSLEGAFDGLDPEEPIEIYTEPELEEAIQNLARSSVAVDAYEIYEELKTGFEKQLSTEDAGTHFNLGKEYLDMELFKEASREFKIALKDKSLGLDCYINLAACSMAEANYDEAIIYYLKILKAFNGSEIHRQGFLYDLALAYDASGQEREAEGIFTSIYETDPRFRDVANKIKKFRGESDAIPVKDSILEVELL